MGCTLGQKSPTEYAIISWSYGSCSGCCQYADMSDAEIEERTRRTFEVTGPNAVRRRYRGRKWSER